ncbi:MAG: MerR family transcriptional regulator [Chloroflexota bacterium]
MPKGLRHTIGETAQLITVSPASLRLWEQEGLLQPQRSEKGHRLYSDEDIIRLRRINYLRNVEKLNLAAIRRELAVAQPEPARPHSTPNQQSDLGRKLRIFRLRRGMTLEQVSERTGLSISFLSTVERGATGISLASLLKLALAYRIHLPDLYGEAKDGGRKLVRTAERQVFENPKAGVRIEQLAHGPVLMEPQLFVLDPGASSEGAYSHEGEEFLFVLEGSIDIYLEESEHFSLEPGDCLYFPSTQFHRWENRGDIQARLLWVNTPPTF